MRSLSGAARAVHVANPVAGWVVYALYGLVIGALLGWLLRDARLAEKTALVAGAIYGIAWWVVAGAVKGVVWNGITRWTPPHHGERVIESHARRAA